MSLITVHLRWNGVGPEQYEQILRAVPGDGRLPVGCLSRQLQRQGNALVAVEVWNQDVAGGRMDHLVRAVQAAGLVDQPLTAMFSIPQMYAAAYRRPGRPEEVPHPRPAPEREQLSAPAGATAR